MLLKVVFKEAGRIKTDRKQTVKFASLSDWVSSWRWILPWLHKLNYISCGHLLKTQGCFVNCIALRLSFSLAFIIARTMENFTFYPVFLMHSWPIRTLIQSQAMFFQLSSCKHSQSMISYSFQPVLAFWLLHFPFAFGQSIIHGHYLCGTSIFAFCIIFYGKKWAKKACLWHNKK